MKAIEILKDIEESKWCGVKPTLSNYNLEDIKKAIKELEELETKDRLAELEEKKMNDLIESIKTTSEYSKYIQAKKDLKDVLKGGKDYHSCSFMDISIRDDRFEARKKELIECIGIFILNKIEEVNG